MSCHSTKKVNYCDMDLRRSNLHVCPKKDEKPFPHNKHNILGTQRASLEESIYLTRDVVSNTTYPMFFDADEGARADLESYLTRVSDDRISAGHVESVRNMPLPLSLTFTPHHFLWQPATDMGRELFSYGNTRIGAAECSPAFKTQVKQAR